MAKTGFLIVIYQDVNPSSPTYNQTREERTQSEEFCPSSAEAHWIEDTKYCELTENGMLTGYEITVYRDVEPLSSTYNQTREEKELNPTECEADSSLPNWQNIGDPFCRQKVYMPGGLMGNDGYMIQQQQDMNEYSETADEIKEIETLDLTNCPLPNTLPEWEVIYEACHIIKQDGQLMFDGTKDVVRIDRNQYSPSWNDNVPETVNVEDLVNCPPDIEVQYRWVGVSDEYMCVGYDKHSVEKKQRSTDGETWVDVIPLQTRAGELIETNSEDCGYEPTIEYRWVVVDEQFICVGFDKHTMEKKQQSVDGGEWTDVTPLETRAGELIEANSLDCGYEPTFEYRWVVITGQYECVDYDKYAVEKKQQSSDGGTTWTDVEPLQTRTGSLIERNSTDCGYLEPQYRWVAISDAFVCVGYDKHEQEKQQVSYDNGTTWEDVVPTNTRTGSLIEHNSEDCGYIPETVYRWVTVSDEYMCVGYDKHTMEKKQQSVDGGTTWTDVVPTETRAGELIEANSEDCGYVPPTPSYETQYLTFEALEDDCRIFLSGVRPNRIYVSISVDGGTTWTEIYTQNLQPLTILNRGEKMLIKANNATYSDYNNYQHFQVSKPYIVYGNIMSLIYGDNFIGQTTLTSNWTFYKLFSGMMTYDGVLGTLVSAENLVLPATTLTQGCYAHMFYMEHRLTTPPVLPATTLAISCYQSMFYQCESLTTAPELPATTLVDGCYSSMFAECANLNYIKCLATDISATGCTTGWVNSVAASGTFTKASSMTDWTTGVNGIPSGWTIQNQ